MSNIINKPIVLVINAKWMVINVRTIRDAIVDLTGGGSGNNPPALAVDVSYPLNEDGTPNYDADPTFGVPMKWAEWIKLPVEPHHLAINTARGQVRAPTVILTPRYAKMPMRRPRWSRRAIFERDGGICQATGEFVPFDQGSIDHLIPRSRGGRNSFENTAWMTKPVNAKKADRTLREAGIRLLRTPKAPPSVPVCATIREAKHPTWKPFLLAS